MNTRLHLFPVDGLCARCDWLVAAETLVNIKETMNPSLVFVSLAWVRDGRLSIPYFAKKVMPLIQNPFTLIVASEDATFPFDIGDVRSKYFGDCQQEIKRILGNPLVKKIFVENLDCIHAKLYPIPLGHLKHNALYAEYERICFENKDVVPFGDRTTTVFCCHQNRVGKQWEKRARVTELARREWKDFTTLCESIDETTFLQNLQQSKFCACVQGGGYDPSPKCWQAIICGAIPVIEHSPLDRAYERLPVVFIDSWDATNITREFLAQWETKLAPFYIPGEKRTRVLEMMRLDYWHDIISRNDESFQSIAVLSTAMVTARGKRIVATYGSEEVKQDVSNLVCRAFLQGDRLEIPPTVALNSVFGDVHQGVAKRLTVVQKNDHGETELTIEIPENRNHAFTFQI